ncbi:MAG: putative Ig domain-containing protein, partial [Betaproteobacteria bacterium]|nr:putative Ig domain-containing protein [Betaproteobacteria bacterium]
AGVVTGTYQISISVVDDGNPPQGDARRFSLTVMAPGQIETGSLAVFEREQPRHALSVRLSARPDRAVTLTVSISDAAAASIDAQTLIFVPQRFNEWQEVQVSISAATARDKDDVSFSVEVAVLDESGGEGLFDTNSSTVDILYRLAAPVTVPGRYVGPGNINPQVTVSIITLAEHAGAATSPAGTPIGEPIAATDRDDDDERLVYSLQPASSRFGIGAGDGQITLSAEMNFNYESGTRIHSVTVKVVDPYGGSTLAPVRISIADINELPQLAPVDNQRVIIGQLFELTIAAAVDEDTDQTHVYTAALADGRAWPSWLVFAAGERIISIAEDASDVLAGIYQISVSVTDDGTPQLGDSEIFVLTVAQPGRIDASSLAGFSRANPSRDLSVRLGEQPGREVTLTLSIADEQLIRVTPVLLTFTPADWDDWQVAQVSISAATANEKDDVQFAVTIGVHDAASGDELYAHVDLLQVAGRYVGPGNANPRFVTDQLVLHESSGDFLTAPGVETTEPVKATDPDNEDASLTYAIDPASSLFGINRDDGRVTVKAATNFNYETGVRQYTVTVRVDDPDGGSVSSPMPILIADINERPVLPRIDDQRVLIGADFNLVLGRAIDEDQGQSHEYFVQQAGGEPLPVWLTFNAEQRRLSIAGDDQRVAEGQYDLEVAVRDSGFPSLAAGSRFRLHLLSGGQLQVQQVSGISAQSPTADLLVKISVRPQGAVTVTITSQQRSIVDVAPTALVFDADNWNVYQSATVRAAAEILGQDASVGYELVLAVHEPTSTDSLYRDALPVTVPGRYYGLANGAPVVSPLTISIYENKANELTPGGTFIGDPVVVFDPNHDVSQMAYRLIDDSGLFKIESAFQYNQRRNISGRSDEQVRPAYGQISLKRNHHFDYDQQSEFPMTVIVQDPFRLESSAMVKVGIIELPANQAPHLASTVFFVDENVGDEFTPAQTTIGSALVADDPDNRTDEITYQIVGDSEQFELVVAAGVATIVTRAAIHFE